MLKKASIVFIISFLIFQSACNVPQGNIEKAEKVDSIKVVLSENIEKLNQIDTVKVKSHYKIIVDDLEEVLVLLGDKKVYNEESIILSDYRALRKNFSKFQPFKKDVNIEAELTIKQLENLSNDLRKGLIEDSKIEEYYQKEFVHALELNERVEGILTGLEKAYTKFDLMKEDVEKIKNLIKNNEH
jgi:hypothetical protein